MRAAFWLQGLCAALVVVALALAWQPSAKRAAALQAVSRGCWLLIAVLAGIGILAYTNFTVFFTAFHRLFFEGDTWLFSYSDTLIQLFPLQFWIDATFILALLALVEALVVGTAAYLLSRRVRRAP
jgi:integral membrane protein (TIGR01906 family)